MPLLFYTKEVFQSSETIDRVAFGEIHICILRPPARLEFFVAARWEERKIQAQKKLNRIA